MYRGFLKLVRDRVRLPTGIESDYELIESGDCSCVLVRTAPGRFLFVRQYRYVIGEITWELPMGTIEVGETPEQAARREVCEETGVVLKDLEPLGTIIPSNGQSTQRIHLFLATAQGELEAQPDASELIEVHHLAVAQIQDLIESGAITDAATLAALLLAERRRCLG